MAEILYIGPVSGYVSPNVVSKGILRALIMSGFHLNVADTTWDGSLNHSDPFFEEHENCLRWLQPNDVANLVNSGRTREEYGSICIAINPSWHLFEIKKQGIKIAGMHVGDVDRIPNQWKIAMEQEDVVLVPSTWGETVVRNSNVKTSVVVINHGIGGAFSNVRTRGDFNYNDATVPFTLLHTCASVFYPERKATPQVVSAFHKLVKDGHNVQLNLIFGIMTKQLKKIIDGIDAEVAKKIEIKFFESNRPQEMIAEEYGNCHALLAPSRAEGFGMMPLEARACGIPVIQTMCTGHQDHFRPNEDYTSWGIVKVPHGAMTKAWGRQFAQAPEVKEEDIYASVIRCMKNWKELKKNALAKSSQVREDWTWERVTRPLAEWIRENSS